MATDGLQWRGPAPLPLFLLALGEQYGLSPRVLKALWRHVQRQSDQRDATLGFYLAQAACPPTDAALCHAVQLLMTRFFSPQVLITTLEALATSGVLRWSEANRAMERILARVDESTLRRWRRRPEFREALEAARQEATEQAMAALQVAIADALLVLRAYLEAQALEPTDEALGKGNCDVTR